MKHNYLEIIELSLSSRKFAYAPYSKFKVGAALLTKSGNLFAGANIESASFSLTICAERVAYSKAISAGEKDIVAIAIASNKRDYLFPCGACRQFMSEFGEETEVILVKSKKEFKTYKLKQLLPEVFSFK
ncbi:MAG TPA: cytidine deaminase [Ignavibacteria bacterium]